MNAPISPASGVGTIPRDTTPCPHCGVPTLTLPRRYREGVVILDVRSHLPCYQVVIHTEFAYAAPSMAYPEHGPLCHVNERSPRA
jgi:hypothetical protein